MAGNFTDAGVSDQERGLAPAPPRDAGAGADAPDAGVALPGVALQFDPDFGKAFEKVRASRLEFLKSINKNGVLQKEIELLLRLDPKTLVSEAAEQADEVLDKAIGVLKKLDPGDPSQKCQSDAFAAIFVTQEGEFASTQSAVLDVFGRVKTGDVGVLSSTVTYYDGGFWCDDETGGYTPKFSSTQCILCSVCWMDVFESLADGVTYKTDALTQTLIHEAVHRLGAFTYKDRSYTNLDKLSLSDALTNAHSYAMAAWNLSRC